MGYSENEFDYRQWNLVDKKVVRSRDIVLMEDKTIKVTKQNQLKPTSQQTTTIIPIDQSHTWSIERKQSLGMAESEMRDSELPTNEDELESANPEQPIDMYVDFDEIFSPVVKMTSIQTILGITSSMDLEIEQLDVKTTFLHGELDKEIYMQQPEGFMEKEKDNLVC